MTQRMELYRLVRGSAQLLVPMVVAGALWFPSMSLLALRLPLSLRGQQTFEVVGNILFLLVGMMLIVTVHERRGQAARRAVEALEDRLAAQDDALRREVELRAQGEERWHGCEQRLRDLTEMSGDAVWEAGPRLSLGQGSTRFAETVGLAVDEIAGRALSDFIDDPGGRLFTRLIPDRSPFRDLPVTLRRAGGDCQALLSGRPTYTATGLYSGYRGMLRDVSRQQAERSAAEQTLRRIETALSISAEGLVAVDDQGVVVLANPSAVRLLGWEGDQLVGRSFLAAVKGGATLEADLRGRGRVSRNGETFLRRDGDPLPFDYVCAPLLRGDSRTGAVIAFHGVTERLRTEREMLAAKDRAERATQAKSEFLANMSHELRTPLNAIMGFSDLMLGELFGPIGNDRYREYIGDIRQSSEHLQAIIDDVLDLSRIESGHLELVEKPIDISVVVEEASTMMRTAAARAGVVLGNNVPGNLPPVRADGRRLRQVLLNLLSNAVKFTPEGGRVDVSAEMAGDGAMVVRVMDTGVGIPADELDKVTQVFVQGNLAIARKHAGAGLGLPLAKHLVQLHGGRLTIDSAVQTGTTVTVWLPPNRLVTEDELAAARAAGE